jgi:hypothetical protein
MSVLSRQDPDTGADEGTWLERIVEQFEDRWEAGPRPEIDAFLPADGPGAGPRWSSWCTWTSSAG